MKVRITDIQKTGSHFEFPLEEKGVNLRLSTHVGEDSQPSDVEGHFVGNPEVSLDLSLDVRTVHASGLVSGVYASPCARCAETATTQLQSAIKMVLKPDSARRSDEGEDQDFEYYSDDEIDCTAMAEEALMLAVPFVVLCREDCKGLCPECGANKNTEPCNCKPQSFGRNPFEALKNIKIPQ